MSPVLHLTGLAGSLRAASVNRVLLEAAGILCAPSLTIDIFDGVGGLPQFNPDLDHEGLLPDSAAAWRAQVAGSDGLLIACPVYAGGLPGAFKNALDWLVGEPAFAGTCVAVFGASDRSKAIVDQLRRVLTMMSANIVDDACVVFHQVTSGMRAEDLAADPQFASLFGEALSTFSARVLAVVGSGGSR